MSSKLWPPGVCEERLVEEPKIRIETREELIFLLAEAAAIEHTLMCCYFYAAWSLKRSGADGLTPEQVVAVTGWRRAISSVAIEEMTHLALANNLLISIGAGPHFSRPAFPVPPVYFPAGVNVELARFSLPVLEHFIFLERPEGKELHDATDFIHPLDYHRTQAKGRLMPSAQDYGTVGHLYRGIRHGLSVLSHHMGETALFCGDVSAQVGHEDAGLPGLSIITDLASADVAIGTIIEQGEGAPSHSETSHFNRFVNIRAEFERFLTADPRFDPAFPVARNPVMTKSMFHEGRVFIGAVEAARVLDLANSVYGHMLRCMVQAFGRHGDAAGKRFFVDVGIDLMEVLPKLCSHLASLPADPHHPGIHAGMTFTMLRDIARLPSGPGEMRVMAERVVEMAHHADRIFPAGHELAATSEALHRIAQRFPVDDLRTVRGARRAT
jgi:hypothetical protein